MLDFAVKVTEAADRITPEDVERLRRAGFDETQVLDVILVAAYRNFMSRVVNAAGLTLEGRTAAVPADFKAAIATGRPA
jgi:alkylhydroperoxidase family enzyme